MDIFEDKYVSVADTYILPLTGLSKQLSIPVNSYLYWRDYRIEDYKLILCFRGEDLTEFLKTEVFSIIDKFGYLIEAYDIIEGVVLVLDMSEWAEDIELCIEGKYSKLSNKAKLLIEKYNSLSKSGAATLKPFLYAALYPNKAVSTWNNKTAIEIVAEEYKFDMTELQKIGELGIKPDKFAETLITEL